MKILFIGGSGIISAACVELAIARQYEVSVLNRGNRSSLANTEQITVDIDDLDTVGRILGARHWDVVADFTVFTPTALESRIKLFQGKTKQYFFISSASAYQKPVQNYVITEETPLVNPFWDYSRNKAACERRLLEAVSEEGFPGVIVRPSLTYGNTQIPLAMNSWQLPFTAIERLRKGKALIVPGDGTSLWTITHSTDFAKGFVGLFGNEKAVGEDFHITSDEVLTWDQIYLATAKVAGVADPKLVHMSSDFIIACLPDLEGTLLGDKAVSAVFDNSKIRTYVPDYGATKKFEVGIRETIENFDKKPELRGIDEVANANYDLLIETYAAGLNAAVEKFTSR